MIGFLFFAVALGQTSPEKLTLDDAVSIAMKNAFTLRIAESKADKARGLERAAKGAFGPTITAQGNYSRFDGSVTGSNNGSSGGSSGGGSGGGGGSSSFTGDTKTASISLTQPIDISGIARKALESTQFNRKAAEAGLGVEANNLKLTVKTAFDNVLLTQALVKVQQDAVTSAQARLDKAVIREREGAIPRFDVLRFQNEVRKGEQALSQAVGNYENSKHALNSALARPIETEFDPQPIDDLPAIPANPSDLVVVALRNRAEVKQSEFTINSLNRTADVQGAAMKPSLIVQATHTRNIDPGPGQQNFGSFESIVISFPLFDSGIARAKVDAAHRDEDQARIGLEQLLLGIALEVRNALTDAQTARKTYDVALDSEKLAAESLRLAEIRYNEGAGILIDVTQAQADLTAAQGNVQNAKYQFLNAYAALLKAVGKDDLNTTELE